jgi:hypothetical protein
MILGGGEAVSLYLFHPEWVERIVNVPCLLAAAVCFRGLNRLNSPEDFISCGKLYWLWSAIS